ncbi:hypothetical protein [Prochlorococcus marinus]|nr:hypothetical protein [Prochlorococcus marinus]
MAKKTYLFPYLNVPQTAHIRYAVFSSNQLEHILRRNLKGKVMSGDFETLEINQPKIKYLKPEDNTEWLDKLINNIEEMKNKISKDS